MHLITVIHRNHSSFFLPAQIWVDRLAYLSFLCADKWPLGKTCVRRKVDNFEKSVFPLTKYAWFHPVPVHSAFFILSCSFRNAYELQNQGLPTYTSESVKLILVSISPVIPSTRVMFSNGHVSRGLIGYICCTSKLNSHSLTSLAKQQNTSHFHMMKLLYSSRERLHGSCLLGFILGMSSA